MSPTLAMSAHAVPMTYLGRDGKQYVAIVAAGASASTTRSRRHRGAGRLRAALSGEQPADDPAGYRRGHHAVDRGRARTGRDSQLHVDETARSWPFRRTIVPAPGPAVIVIPALHDAFPTGQTGSARLVTTQSTYQLQRWLDWLDASPSTVAVGVVVEPLS